MKTHKFFSYRKGNIGELDEIMGPNWDRKSEHGRTKFVTSVKFHRGANDLMSATIKISVCPHESARRVGVLEFINM